MQCGLFLTAIWTLLLFQNGVQLSKVLATRQPGYLDFDNLPETNFTCEDKVIGGYYADIETGCQMFHVCTIGQKGDMTDIKFLCLNGTVFDQETRVCERVDEVDCSKSKDFYDLNLELYKNGYVLSEEEENNGEGAKSDEELESGEAYDENYETETEESPASTPKGGRTSNATSTTTTTTAASSTAGTTTSKPILFSTIKPTYGILIPNTKIKNTPVHAIGLQPHGFDNKNVPVSNKPVGAIVRGGMQVQTNYQGLVANRQPQQQQQQQQQQQHPHQHQHQQSLDNKNLGSPQYAGLIPTKTQQTPKPYGYVTTQTYDQGQFNKMHPLDMGLKPPPTSFKPYIPTSSYKPPTYDTFKNHYFPSSTPNPITSILINNYDQKHQGIEEIHSSEQAKRPVVVVSHHFPTITPVKSNYDDYNGFASLTAPGNPYVRQPPHPQQQLQHQLQQQQQQQQQQYRANVKIQHHHQHKANPTILALQSQQKKVHQLHQEGLEQAEHQIAQIANRNAEISNLRSQKIEDRKDYLESQSSHRETKEIHVGDQSHYAKPAIAIVTSTSSTSSRIQNKPVLAPYAKTVPLHGTGKHVIYTQRPEYKTELEKLFATAEQAQKRAQDSREPVGEEENDEDDDDDAGPGEDEEDADDGEHDEGDSDMDLEQLLLAWKLKTNQEVTKEDIERVFSSLDTSKFKNGQTISLSDIFKIMKNVSAEETTRSAPISYDDYTEEDVPYDPFYKDVPKVSNAPPVSRRIKRSQIADFHAEFLRDARPERNGIGNRNAALVVAEFELLPDESSVQVADASSKPFPDTTFTCDGKIPGGYYADVEGDCEFFHVCSDAGNGSLTDHKFYCGDGTRFNQRTRICEPKESVRCRSSSDYYHLNRNFLIPSTESVPEIVFESKKITS